MRLVPLAAALALAAAARPAAAHPWGAGVHGNGEKTTAVREVPAFTKVRLGTSLDVRVKVGAPQRVAVTIDSNLQPEVETTVEGSTLVIDAKRAIQYQGRGVVEIAVPALRGFEIAGSGDVQIDGGEGDLALEIEGSGDLRWSGRATALRTSISGSGDIRLSGKADRLTVDVDGSGDVGARELTASSAEVEVDGSGNVELTLAGGTLSAAVAGSGDVTWFGEGKVERASVSGSGNVQHR